MQRLLLVLLPELHGEGDGFGLVVAACLGKGQGDHAGGRGGIGQAVLELHRDSPAHNLGIAGGKDVAAGDGAQGEGAGAGKAEEGGVLGVLGGVAVADGEFLVLTLGQLGLGNGEFHRGGGQRQGVVAGQEAAAVNQVQAADVDGVLAHALALLSRQRALKGGRLAGDGGGDIIGQGGIVPAEGLALAGARGDGDGGGADAGRHALGLGGKGVVARPGAGEGVAGEGDGLVLARVLAVEGGGAGGDCHSVPDHQAVDDGGAGDGGGGAAVIGLILRAKAGDGDALGGDGEVLPGGVDLPAGLAGDGDGIIARVRGDAGDGAAVLTLVGDGGGNGALRLDIGGGIGRVAVGPAGHREALEGLRGLGHDGHGEGPGRQVDIVGVCPGGDPDGDFGGQQDSAGHRELFVRAERDAHGGVHQLAVHRILLVPLYVGPVGPADLLGDAVIDDGGILGEGEGAVSPGNGDGPLVLRQADGGGVEVVALGHLHPDGVIPGVVQGLALGAAQAVPDGDVAHAGEAGLQADGAGDGLLLRPVDKAGGGGEIEVVRRGGSLLDLIIHPEGVAADLDGGPVIPGIGGNRAAKAGIALRFLALIGGADHLGAGCQGVGEHRRFPVAVVDEGAAVGGGDGDAAAPLLAVGTLGGDGGLVAADGILPGVLMEGEVEVAAVLGDQIGLAAVGREDFGIVHRVKGALSELDVVPGGGLKFGGDANAGVLGQVIDFDDDAGERRDVAGGAAGIFLRAHGLGAAHDVVDDFGIIADGAVAVTVDAHAAAQVVGVIAGDLAAVHIEVAAVYKHAAAGVVGGVADDLTAVHLEDAVHIHSAAIAVVAIGDGGVAGNGAAIHVEAAAVAADVGDIYAAALCDVVRVTADSLIVGDGTAVHIEVAALVAAHADEHAAAVACGGVAGDVAAVQIEFCAAIDEHAAAAAALLGDDAVTGAAAVAVGEGKGLVILNDEVAEEAIAARIGDAVAVEAEVHGILAAPGVGELHLLCEVVAAGPGDLIQGGDGLPEHVVVGVGAGVGAVRAADGVEMEGAVIEDDAVAPPLLGVAAGADKGVQVAVLDGIAVGPAGDNGAVTVGDVSRAHDDVGTGAQRPAHGDGLVIPQEEVAVGVAGDSGGAGQGDGDGLAECRVHAADAQGGGVAGDGAAGHGEGTVTDVYAAAVAGAGAPPARIGGRIAGDGAAGHDEGALAGYAGAVAHEGVAGDGAAVHGKGAIGVYAPALEGVRVGDDAVALAAGIAVGEGKAAVTRHGDDGETALGGDAVAVEAEHHLAAADGGIPGVTDLHIRLQVIAARLFNFGEAGDADPFHLGVPAAVGAAVAADGVGVALHLHLAIRIEHGLSAGIRNEIPGGRHAAHIGAPAFGDDALVAVCQGHTDARRVIQSARDGYGPVSGTDQVDIVGRIADIFAVRPCAALDVAGDGHIAADAHDAGAHIHAAALAICRVAGDGAAGQVDLELAAVVFCQAHTAAIRHRLVAGDGAAAHVELGTAQPHAAAAGCIGSGRGRGRVAGDGAAVQVEHVAHHAHAGAAGRCVIADGAAVHVERAVVYKHAAAVGVLLVAGDGTAVQIERAAVHIHAVAGIAGFVGDGARTLAVGDGEGGSQGGTGIVVIEPDGGLIGRAGDGVAVEAEHHRVVLDGELPGVGELDIRLQVVVARLRNFGEAGDPLPVFLRFVGALAGVGAGGAADRVGSVLDGHLEVNVAGFRMIDDLVARGVRVELCRVGRRWGIGAAVDALGGQQGVGRIPGAGKADVGARLQGAYDGGGGAEAHVIRRAVRLRVAGNDRLAGEVEVAAGLGMGDATAAVDGDVAGDGAAAQIEGAVGSADAGAVVGPVAADGAAGHGEGAMAHVHTAAAAVFGDVAVSGRCAAYGAAAHVEYGALPRHVHAGAVALGEGVAGDGAAGHGEGAALHVHTAAAGHGIDGGGGAVVGDGAVMQVECTVGHVYAAAVVGGGVAGDGAAVHVKGAPRHVHAALGADVDARFIGSGEGAAIQGKAAAGIHTHAGIVLLRAHNLAGVSRAAVAEIEHSAGFDFDKPAALAAADGLDAVAVEAEVHRAPDEDPGVNRNILIQIVAALRQDGGAIRARGIVGQPHAVHIQVIALDRQRLLGRKDIRRPGLRRADGAARPVGAEGMGGVARAGPYLHLPGLRGGSFAAAGLLLRVRRLRKGRRGQQRQAQGQGRDQTDQTFLHR